MDFQAKSLYPVPQVLAPNIEYAKLLLQDYAGDVSEDTAIHLYIFQSFVKNKQYQKLANDLFHISIVEMHHLKLLGSTIQLLGLAPEFITYESKNGGKQYWSSRYVDYNQTVTGLLKADIESEKKAIEAYQLHAKMIDDPYIQALIYRIIEDEIIHLDYFEKQYAYFQNIEKGLDIRDKD